MIKVNNNMVIILYFYRLDDYVMMIRPIGIDAYVDLYAFYIHLPL